MAHNLVVKVSKLAFQLCAFNIYIRHVIKITCISTFSYGFTYGRRKGALIENEQLILKNILK